MWKVLTANSILPYALLGMTAVTGLIGAASYLSLGHVFTANMIGNIVLLAFASTGVPQVSLARSIGGRIMANASAAVQPRAAGSVFCIGDCFLSRSNSARTWLWCPFISAFPTALRDDRFHSHSDGD
jgi:hypothetical protein